MRARWEASRGQSRRRMKRRALRQHQSRGNRVTWLRPSLQMKPTERKRGSRRKKMRRLQQANGRARVRTATTRRSGLPSARGPARSELATWSSRGGAGGQQVARCLREGVVGLQTSGVTQLFGTYPREHGRPTSPPEVLRLDCVRG